MVTIAAVVAERIRAQPDVVARFLETESDEPISAICRAAGFSLNGFSAILRMRRRRSHGSRNATEALAYFSSLNRASAERILQQMIPQPARPGRRFR